MGDQFEVLKGKRCINLQFCIQLKTCFKQKSKEKYCQINKTSFCHQQIHTTKESEENFQGEEMMQDKIQNLQKETKRTGNDKYISECKRQFSFLYSMI